MEGSEPSLYNDNIVLTVVVPTIITVIIISCITLTCCLNHTSCMLMNNPNDEENGSSRFRKWWSANGGLKTTFNLTDRRISEQLNL